MSVLTAGTSSARWGVFDRALMIALVLAMIPGIPGVGIETRASGSDALVAVYTVAGLAPIVALAASWKWPLAAGWIGVVAGVLATALGALDLGGILGGPSPARHDRSGCGLRDRRRRGGVGQLACHTPLSRKPRRVAVAIEPARNVPNAEAADVLHRLAAMILTRPGLRRVRGDRGASA